MTPTTLEEAVDCLVELAKEENITNNIGSPMSHHTLGRAVRNDFGLWQPDSPIIKDCKEKYGIWHPDDVSSIIRQWAEAKLKNRPFDIQPLVARYKAHWDKFKPLKRGNNDETNNT